MQTEARPPSSPRNDDHHGWMLVERPLKDGVADAMDLRQELFRISILHAKVLSLTSLSF